MQVSLSVHQIFFGCIVAAVATAAVFELLYVLVVLELVAIEVAAAALVLVELG